MANQINHTFPHHRLEVYNLAVEMAVQAKKVADAVPRGRKGMADQLFRASTPVVLNIAEGANPVGLTCQVRWRATFVAFGRGRSSSSRFGYVSLFASETLGAAPPAINVQ